MRPKDESYVSPTGKYLLFVSNFLFWVAGVGLALIGAWAFVTKELEGSKKLTSAWSYVFDVSLIFITVGIVAFCIASAGCIGTLRENVCLLKMYCAMLSLIDIALIVVGIVGLLMWNKFVESAKVRLSVELIRSYNDDPDLADFLNFVQEKFKCCGLSDKGFEEWSENAYYNCTKENLDVRRCGVPHSCCKDWKNLEKSRSNYYCGYKVRNIEADGRILREANMNDRIYATGCIERVVSTIKDNVLLFSLSAFGFALLPMISVYLARNLISQIEMQKSRWFINIDRLRLHNNVGNTRYITSRA